MSLLHPLQNQTNNFGGGGGAASNSKNNSSENLYDGGNLLLLGENISGLSSIMDGTNGNGNGNAGNYRQTYQLTNPEHRQQHHNHHHQQVGISSSAFFPISPDSDDMHLNNNNNSNNTMNIGFNNNSQVDDNGSMPMPFMSNGNGSLSPEVFLSTSPLMNNNNTLHSRNHSMTSPAMATHNNYQASRQSSPLMSPHMSPLLMTNSGPSIQMQFNLSPPLTISNSPELHYAISNHSPDMQFGGNQQQQLQQYDTYEEQQPIYQFMGMSDPNLQQQHDSYEDPYTTFQQNQQHLQMMQGGEYLPAPIPPQKVRGKGKKTKKQLAAEAKAALAASYPVGSASLFSTDGNEGLGGIQGDWPEQIQVGQEQALEELPQFPCEFPGCTKVFTKQTNLKSHSRIHHTERNYACADCGASFRRSHDLKRHQRSLHSDVKPFECSRCSKRFSRMDALRRHTSRKTSACFEGSNQILII